LLAVEVAFHKRIVGLDDVFYQFGVGPGHIHQRRITGFVFNTINDGCFVGGGQIGAAALRAEGFLNTFEQLWQVNIFSVNFIYDNYSGQIGVCGQLKELACVGLYAGCCADDNDGGFGGWYGCDGRAYEIRGAGGVDNVD